MSEFYALIVIVFWLFFVVKAQASSSEYDSDFLHPLHPNVAAIVGVLSVAFSISFLVLVYAKFCQSNPNSNRDARHQNLQELVVQSRSRLSGIDKAVIESLPFFRFASLKGSKEGLECAVCLSTFEDTEVLRLLPKCRHAFHVSCIDQWLEGHASCPLCRYHFDIKDLRSFSYSNSLRFLRVPSNLSEEPNLEIFVEREQSHQGSSSSRFNLGSSFRKIDRGKNDEELLNDDQKLLLHKFKHKIIVSNVVFKSRWSDVNSSDLLFLNSEMLSVMTSNRFCHSNSTSGRFNHGFSVNDNMVKNKEHTERKRLYEPEFNGIDRSRLSISGSRISSCDYEDENSSKISIDKEKRSMSEITNFARFKELSTREKVIEAAAGTSGRKEERIRRLWLPIMQRTVHWFSGRGRNFQESELRRHVFNM